MGEIGCGLGGCGVLWDGVGYRMVVLRGHSLARILGGEGAGRGSRSLGVRCRTLLCRLSVRYGLSWEA